MDLFEARRLVRPFLAEDIGRGDVTTRSTIPPGMPGRASIEVEQDAIVAGLTIARACFEEVEGAPVEWHAKAADGDQVRSGDIVAVVEAGMRTILSAERTALNLLARISGVATSAAAFAAAVEGTGARVVDTRKTMPGLRVLDKYGVRTGGALNHRFGLDDGVLIKDNHVAAVGGIMEALRAARQQAVHGLLVEVEVQDLDQLELALDAGADAILLDNMSPEDVRAAVERTGGRVILEASGGITLENVRDYALTGVDLVSSGAMTHSAPHIDFSLEIER